MAAEDYEEQDSSSVIESQTKIENTLVSEATSLAENAVGELLNKVAEPIAKVQEALSKLGVANDVINSLVMGNLADVDSMILGLVSSVLPIDQLKKLSKIELRSLAISLSPKIKALHGGIGSVMDNIRQGLNISMSDIINSDVLKNQLSSLGIPTTVLGKIDLSKATSIEGLTSELANATGISNIGDNLNGLWKDTSSLVNNFGSNKITKDCLSKITNSGSKNAIDILKRFA